MIVCLCVPTWILFFLNMISPLLSFSPLVVCVFQYVFSSRLLFVCFSLMIYYRSVLSGAHKSMSDMYREQLVMVSDAFHVYISALPLVVIKLTVHDDFCLTGAKVVTISTWWERWLFTLLSVWQDKGRDNKYLIVNVAVHVAIWLTDKGRDNQHLIVKVTACSRCFLFDRGDGSRCFLFDKIRVVTSYTW